MDQAGTEADRRIEGLYRDAWPQARAIALRLLDDPAAAEDAVSTVLVRMWRRAREGTLPDNPEAYLMTGVRNEARSQLRARARRAERFDVPERGAVERGFATVEERALLAAALAGLTDRQRRLLALRYVEGAELHDIADRLGVHLGTVKSGVHRALASVRRQSAGLGAELAA